MSTEERTAAEGNVAGALESPKQGTIGVNPQDATLLLDVSPNSDAMAAAAADFAVTVHDESQEPSLGESAHHSPTGVAAPKKAGAVADAAPPQHAFHDAIAPPPTEEPTRKIPDAAAAAVHKGRRRKRLRGGRVVRTAPVVDEVTVSSKALHLGGGLAEPPHHFECTLVRRSVRKADDNNAGRAAAADPSGEVAEEEEVGDVSLGMKLTVISGKVIVQQLNPLLDGRASPAQLVGLVKRGDVLLSINNFSLVNLPIDQLMRGLSPLSTPDSQGVYQKTLHLRFASGEGLFILQRGMAAQAGADVGSSREHDGAAEVFSLFPMVDQLSGMPLFDTEHTVSLRPAAGMASRPTSTETQEGPPLTPRKEKDVHVEVPTLTLDERISHDLARNRHKERENFISEYFSWKDEAAFKTLNDTVVSADYDSDIAQNHEEPSIEPSLSLNQIIERGRRAVLGARAISDRMESADRGKDGKSLRSWKTTISLYSRESARRRAMQAFDTASVPVNFGRLEEEGESDDDLSADTSNSEEVGEPFDADAQLLRLAARDEPWKEQVLQFLEKVTREKEQEGKIPEQGEEMGDTPAPETIDTALSSELGNFLFGENMSRILTKHKKPQALPPDEITALLYDLTTKITATIPEEIAATGSQQGSQNSSITPFIGKRNSDSNVDDDVHLASLFLLEKALPAWLKSFRPLPWEQRRILWPLDKPAFGGSTTASSTFSDDSFTLESFGTNQVFPSGASMLQKRKNLRERIEDLELNAEARAETCYLATYYFTQDILPRFALDNNADTLEEALRFVREFGSYLKLHPSFAKAAAVHSPEVISILLDLARHDPRHKEIMKLAAKPSSLSFYEPSILSSVVERLQGLRNVFSPVHWLATIDLCAAAYPDVLPWQVRVACTPELGKDSGTGSTVLPESKQNELADLYYVYMTQLLHPMDGHDLARKDTELVREWCELSVRGVDHNTFKERAFDRRRNFFSVASRTSSDHLVYARELLLLLQLSNEVGDSDLELDIVGEILENRFDSVSGETVRAAIEQLKVLATNALDDFEDTESPASRKLRRSLRVYQIASSRAHKGFGIDLDVPSELLRWIRHVGATKRPRARTLQLVRFLAGEAHPEHLLEAIRAWTESSAPYFERELIPVLQTVLRRAASKQVTVEFSGSLSKLRRARQQLHRYEDDASNEEHQNEVPEPHIWSRMSSGMIPVFK